MRRVALPLMLAAMATVQLEAQGRPAVPNAAAIRRAVETITEADVRRRVGILADDSMRGRGTPSRELEVAASWIAQEFRRFGLRPGGDNGTFFQRFTMRESLVDTTSFIAVDGGVRAQWMFGRDAIFHQGPLPADPVSGPAVLVSGFPADTIRPFGDANLSGAVVLHYVTLQQLQQGDLGGLISRAVGAGARAWVLVINRPPVQFAGAARFRQRAQFQLLERTPQSGLPIFEVRDSATVRMLRAAGEDLAALHGGAAGGVRHLPGMTLTVGIRVQVLREATAPNVVGILDGSDPALRNEYLFFTAHMDHTGAVGMGNGCSAAGADSICNGADDNASGTTGVIELAEAFAALNPRPRRSMVFVLVSGEERGLWGSQHYVENPTVPLAQGVAAINMDMIGRNWRDTVVVIGKEHSSLGALADRVANAHPELNMALIDDIWPEENFYFRSDHYHFARKGVPILFFFTGVHPDYHRPTDHPELIDAEKTARVARMIFHVGLEIANAPARPDWNPESRRRIVQVGP